MLNVRAQRAQAANISRELAQIRQELNNAQAQIEACENKENEYAVALQQIAAAKSQNVESKAKNLAAKSQNAAEKNQNSASQAQNAIAKAQNAAQKEKLDILRAQALAKKAQLASPVGIKA